MPAPAAPAQLRPLPPEAAARTITADYLRAQVTRLASDEFEGRGTASRGDQAARTHLVEQLAALGIQPGRGALGWEQKFEIVGVRATMPAVFRFENKGKRLDLKWWDHYVGGSGVQTEKGGIDAAEVVFVGYGIEAPEYAWNDFKNYDVRGKVLLMLNNDPDWDPALFGGEARLNYGRWPYKYESAARHGAVGAIIVHTAESAGYPFQVLQNSWSSERFELPSTEPNTLQVKSWVTEAAARDLVAFAGRDLNELIKSARSKAFAPVPLGIKTSLQFSNRVQRTQTANVYGLIKGSDPRLSDEYVVLSAHHDHLGIGKADATGDAIYNGALDNAVGCAQVLAIAKAFAALTSPPRRSIFFLFVGAEEQGLLGSQYFTRQPPVAAGKLVANFNFDGGNIWGRTRDITEIGRGKSTLDEAIGKAAALQGRRVEADQFPDRGSFYRSDQVSFAQIGVPAVSLKTGTEFLGRPPSWGPAQIVDYETHHYHRPSDQITKEWNFEGMVEDTQLGFLAALEVATAEQPPSWVPGDEFEAAGRAALESLKPVSLPVTP